MDRLFGWQRDLQFDTKQCSSKNKKQYVRNHNNNNNNNNKSNDNKTQLILTAPGSVL